MTDQFRVGEFAELCNLPDWAARLNGVEVLIIEPARERKWKFCGRPMSGVAYIVSYDNEPRVACPPQYLRKRRPPIDTVDASDPYKVTNWNECPWWPEKLVRETR